MIARLARHWGLMTAMSQRAEVDLSAEFLSDRLSLEDLRGALGRCTDCPNVGECERFLIEDGDAPDGIPEYCQNKSMFLEIQATR